MPVPALPTTIATPAPSPVSRRTISACSAASVGRRAIARSTARGGDAGPGVLSVGDRCTIRRSSSSSSGVEYARSSGSARTTRPSRRRRTSDRAVRSPTASTTARSERRKRSARSSTSLADTSAPAGSCSQNPWIVSRRVNVERRCVSPVDRREPLGRPLLELGVDRGRPGPVEQTADPLRAQAEAGGALAPLGHELLGRDPVVLAPARVERGDLRRSGARRAAALELRLDVGAAAAERAERFRRHAGDVRDPVADRAPLDAQLARELGAQPSLVEVAGGLGVRVEPAAVERRPAPIGAEREVGDEHVGVQLRVAGARGAMHERRGDQPSPGDAVDARGSAPRDRGLALDVAESVLNRPVVRGADRSAHAVIADAEQHAHALGRRERQIEAWHSRRCLAAERHAIRRVLAGQHAMQLLTVDLAAQAEQRRAVADPLAGRLGPGEVVVVDAAGHGAGPGGRPVGLLEVVVGVADGDLSDREHLRL